MSQRLLRERLRTVQIVPLTAFDCRDQLALAPMRALTERLREAGLQVFIPCAGSAEFHSLAAEEILAAVEMTRQVVGSEAVVMAPIGQQLHQALRLGQQARQAGADCLLVMPLAFPYLCDAGAGDYYRTLLDTLDAPLLIYKKDPIPSDRLLLELAGHPNLIGVKYAVNDLDAFQRVVEQDGGRIDWFCGSAERFAPYFALAGARGYTSGAGNLCPRLTLSLHRALLAGQWSQAMHLQRLLLPIEHYRARSANSYNITFLKYALKHTGLDFGPPRPPQRQLTPDEMQQIDHMLPALLQAEQQA